MTQNNNIKMKKNIVIDLSLNGNNIIYFFSFFLTK